MIITNDRYLMTETENSMYAVQMTLVVRKLQKSDMGGYKCISKNSIGDAEGTIRLYGEFCLRRIMRGVSEDDVTECVSTHKPVSHCSAQKCCHVPIFLLAELHEISLHEYFDPFLFRKPTLGVENQFLFFRSLLPPPWHRTYADGTI
jgi:hypothetical protein